MSEETLEISFDEIEKEREKYLLVDTRDKVTVEYGMIRSNLCSGTGTGRAGRRTEGG